MVLAQAELLGKDWMRDFSARSAALVFSSAFRLRLRAGLRRKEGKFAQIFSRP